MHLICYSSLPPAGIYLSYRSLCYPNISSPSDTPLSILQDGRTSCARSRCSTTGWRSSPSSTRCSCPLAPSASSSPSASERESLVVQKLSSGSSARSVLRHLFALYDTLLLLDYDDDQSISNFKMLQLHCGDGGGGREAQR